MTSRTRFESPTSETLQHFRKGLESGLETLIGDGNLMEIGLEAVNQLCQKLSECHDANFSDNSITLHVDKECGSYFLR